MTFRVPYNCLAHDELSVLICKKISSWWYEWKKKDVLVMGNDKAILLKPGDKVNMHQNISK